MDSGLYNYDLESVRQLAIKIFGIYILAVKQHFCQTQLQTGDTMQSTFNLKVAVACVLFFHTTTTNCGEDSALYPGSGYKAS